MATPASDTLLTPGEVAEAKELDRRFLDALNRKDLDAAMACFWNHPDVIFVAFGKVLRGIEAIRQFTAELFAQNVSLKVEAKEVTYLPTGDAVIGAGTAVFHLQPTKGPRRLMVECWSDLRRKIDGRWVYVLDHAAAGAE
jgi:uncharacterized protein (TIGR02246 family)